VFVRSSVGVAVSGPDARTATDLLRNADVAVHTASATRGENYQVFDPGMRASIVERLELESDLKQALERGEFELHYQPVVQLHDWERVCGVEALIRWIRPGRGMVPPTKFIPIAEETGLIELIGAWVMREGCRQLREWAATRPDLTVSINLSPMQFGQPDVANTIADIIAETEADPSRIVVELTESALVDDSEANRDKLHAIKATGVRLALDDFGTGYSSLGYLRQFPFDIIKIDRSFVKDVDVDEGAAALASSVIRIAKALKLTSLAEGVDTVGQATWLARTGCDAAQGFLFARPVPASQLFPLLTDGLSVPEVARAGL
jgi:EAL domain-containing protein (putative c-di-GMP-specific phosphodiesterase class I)